MENMEERFYAVMKVNGNRYIKKICSTEHLTENELIENLLNGNFIPSRLGRFIAILFDQNKMNLEALSRLCDTILILKRLKGFKCDSNFNILNLSFLSYPTLRTKLPFSFLKKYAKDIDWKNMFDNTLILKNDNPAILKFSEKEIEEINNENPPKNWLKFYKFQNFSMSFIEKYEALVNWECVSKMSSLNEEFINKYASKVYWPNIFQYQKCSNEFGLAMAEKYKNLAPFILKYLVKYKKLSEEQIEKIADGLGASSWRHISKRNYSMDFIKKYKEKLNWRTISAKYSFTEEQFLEVLDKIDLNVFLTNNQNTNWKQWNNGGRLFIELNWKGNK